MSLMIAIARTDPKKPYAEWRAEHDKVFGPYVTIVTVLREREDSAQVATLLDVHDLEGLRAISRTPKGDALMRKSGFIEQLAFFAEPLRVPESATA